MIAVIAAMEKEANALLSVSTPLQKYRRYGKEITEGELNGIPYTLVLSGIGKTNAAAAAMLALALGADKILNIGVAGGLTPQAKIGAVLQIEKAAQYDFDLSSINGTPVGTLDEYQSPYFPLACRTNSFEKGILATGDRFGCGNQDDGVLRALKADVRDMEGAAIAHIAYAAGVPCFQFKAISDNAGENSVKEYRENLQTALSALAGHMAEIFDEVLHG